jgi:hypothetical protein
MPPFRYAVGDTRPALAFTIEDEKGNPVNITGATFAGLASPMRFKNVRTGIVFYGTGTCSVISPLDGQIAYVPSATDFTAAREGEYRVQISIDIDGAGHIATLEPLDTGDVLMIGDRFTI